MTSTSFVLDPSAKTSLPQQLAQAIRTAIANGRLKEGQSLPPIRKLAEDLGTSLRVPREALQILSCEGFVAPRRGSGTVVLHKRPLPPQKHVLLVHPNSYGAYYFGVLVEQVNRPLEADGHLVSHVAVDRLSKGDFDYGPLRNSLRRWKFDAALAITFDDRIFKPLEDLSIPYLACSYLPKRYPGAIGRIECDYRAAVSDFVAHCTARGVKKVLQLSPSLQMIDVSRPLADVGIATETISIPLPKSAAGMQEEVERQAYVLLKRRLSAGRIPDLLFVPDDFAVRGSLLALAENHLDIPGDIRLVAWINSRFSPASPIALTRMEMNPYEHGKIIADAFRTFLKTGKPPSGVRIGPAYVKAESFS